MVEIIAILYHYLLYSGIGEQLFNDRFNDEKIFDGYLSLAQ